MDESSTANPSKETDQSAATQSTQESSGVSVGAQQGWPDFITVEDCLADAPYG